MHDLGEQNDGEAAPLDAKGLTKMAFGGLGIALGLPGLVLIAALVVVLVRLVL